MKKSTLWLVAILWLATVLTGCNSKEVWDVDYDLSTEMGRQLHCYAEFQRDHQAKQYWAEWVREVNNGFGAVVEWKIKADEKEYYVVCNYSDDIADWTLNATPISEWIAIGNPASEYCINQWWTFEIVSNETDIYGECTLPDGTQCEEWSFYNGECWASDDEEIQTTEFDLQTEEGRLAACEERAGFYLNFNEWTFVWNDESEGWASFIRNWHVTYLKWWENAEDDVECVVDMVDWSVNVEFSNHIYNGELQEERLVLDEQPAAKMRVLEWETAEETMARMEEVCENMWGEGTDGVCTLDDGSVVAF